MLIMCNLKLPFVKKLFCFIGDTYNTSFVIDTGANWVIVKDSKLLHDFQACSDGVKGVEWKSCIDTRKGILLGLFES